MKSRLTLLGLVLNTVVAVSLAAVMLRRGDTTGAVFVAWMALSSLDQMYFLARKIDRIGDQLGFGVSVPITEMPRVMESISNRLKTRTETTGTTDGQRSKSQSTSHSQFTKRPKRDILAELVDLEGETA